MNPLSPLRAKLRLFLALPFLLFLLAGFSCSAAPNPSLQLIGPDSLQALLKQNRNRPVLLHYWASWCGSCKEDLSVLHHWEQKNTEKKIYIIYVSIDDANDKARRALVRSIYQEAGIMKNTYISNAKDPRPIMTVLDPNWLEIVPITYLLEPSEKEPERYVGRRSLRSLLLRLDRL